MDGGDSNSKQGVTTVDNSSTIRALQVLFVGLLAAIVYVLVTTQPGDYARDPGMIPAFELQQIPEGTLTQADLDGHITVLNFFATWCGPCVGEMPELVRFAASLDEDVQLIGVSAGYDTLDQVLPFLDTHSVNFPVVLQGEKLLNKVGSESLPTTLITDSSGRVVVSFEGPITRSQLDAAVQRVRAGYGPGAKSDL